MASPDTDELATVPLPSGQQVPAVQEARVAPGRGGALPLGSEAETAPQELAEVEQAAAEAPTVEQERVAPEDGGSSASAGSAKPRGRWWRGFTGSLAAGLVVLAVGVLVVGIICLFTGAPGPGAASLIGHPVAAALALAAQRVADRRSGLAAAGGGVAVGLFAVSAATLFWFS